MVISARLGHFCRYLAATFFLCQQLEEYFQMLYFLGITEYTKSPCNSSDNTNKELDWSPLYLFLFAFVYC